ncbi:GNAT family N-acetyltransferase [Nocardia alni]|uniref:GNAT family N-acetyltransferase n=1 Tax=Nocardia alni TaxID=2815723 RepID=UPI001C226A78|nr:GNAT family N-acetyltransferase [Nocardia alni]
MRDVSQDVEIETERLILRRPAPGDADAILEIGRHPHPGVTTIRTQAMAQRQFQDWDDHWRRYRYGYWVIRYRENTAADAVVGFCGIRSMNMHEGPALNLYYHLAEAVRGRGLATEAAAAVVAWSRAHLPELPVIARIQPGNSDSERVALRAGLAAAEHLNTDSWIHYCDPAGWGRES